MPDGDLGLDVHDAKLTQDHGGGSRGSAYPPGMACQNQTA
jgi:hypothetical protein